MTFSPFARPALILVATCSVAACSAPREDAHLFEHFADSVAAIPIDAGARPAAKGQNAAQAQDQSQARAEPLKIDLIEKLARKDAHTDGLKAAVAMVDSQFAGLKRLVVSDPAAEPASTRDASGYTARLAAFPSQDAARAAWARLKAAHPEALARFSPRFEAVDLGARGVWTRLETSPLPSREAAAAVCSEIGVADRWCVAQTRG